MQATAKVIPFVPLTQAIPAVEAVTQTELCLLLSLRGRLRQLQEQLEAEEQGIGAVHAGPAGVSASQRSTKVCDVFSSEGEK